MDNNGINFEKNEIAIDMRTNEIEAKVSHSPEVVSLAKSVDLNNVESVMGFGGQTAVEISQFADKILKTIETNSIEDSSSLLTQLGKIMDKFDAKDFEEKKPGLLEKIFNKAKNSIDGLFKKYHSMGDEVDKVYIQLKEYESSIKDSNRVLSEMFEKNMDYYEILEKYIHAGEYILNEINTKLIPDLESKNTGNDMDRLNVSKAYEIKEVVEQRVFDLQLAKNVALQTMPQIRLIQKGNYNLVRKINSAFIITIPIFKQSLIQAITLKRQSVQAKALSALDEKTNELLLRNAENTAMQSTMINKLSSSSSIKLETLEQTWSTIMKGIEETREIQRQAQQERIEGAKRLDEIQQEFISKSKGH